MFLFGVLIPLVACYATDCVAFDGDYFGRFAATFDATTAARTLAAVPDALAGSLELPDPVAYVRANSVTLGLCPLDDEGLRCR